MTTGALVFLLGLVASASADPFAPKKQFTDIAKALSAQGRKLAAHDSGDMAWAAPCMGHCPQLTDLMALQGLPESPTWAQVKEVACGDNLATINCVIEKCGADPELKDDPAFQGIKGILEPMSCGCDCDDVGVIMVDGLPLMEKDITGAADKICPILPTAMECGTGKAVCEAIETGPMASVLDVVDAVCVAKKYDCQLDDGKADSFEKCTDNADMKACSEDATTGKALDAAKCCPAGKAATECMGNPACVQIALGAAMMMDPSGTTTKAVDAWNAACPDEIPSAADIEKKMAAKDFDPPKSDSAADAAMPRAGPLSLGLAGLLLLLLAKC